ncbi:MAG: cytochrome c [Gemmatimonadales bacterium]
MLASSIVAFAGSLMNRPALLSVPLALILSIGCSDSSQGPLDPAIPRADPVLGQMAFEQSCAGCHASSDGFDLKTFGFTDTTIIRRAVKHVDSATARNIVAYIHGLAAPHNDKMMSLFQPRGAPIGGDVEFANALFGRDAWPAELTTAQLAGIDPRGVQVAIRLPVWADEVSNTDWMPDLPLPAGVLNYSGGLVAGAIAGYRAAPTPENLIRAVNALRAADHAIANPAAPCLLEDTLRVRFRECFEVRRWTSTLVALHLLRNGMDLALGGQVHDVWWDVGNAARKSRTDPTMPIANAVQNWTSWMFLGWSFDPSRHASVYTGGGFRQLGLTRHATFVALRSQVARPKNSLLTYEDLVNAVRFAPPAWTTSVAGFGLRHLNERLSVGDRPTSVDQIASAIASVNTALTEAYRKAPVADRGKIESLGLPVLAALQQ